MLIILDIVGINCFQHMYCNIFCCYISYNESMLLLCLMGRFYMMLLHVKCFKFNIVTVIIKNDFYIF